MTPEGACQQRTSAQQTFLSSDGDLVTAARTLPPPSEEDCLVQVVASGVCGTDIGQYQARKAAPGQLGEQAIGHEVAGVVRAGGKALPPGSRVVLDPCLACGACPHCISGRTNLCDTLTVIGSNSALAGLADYMVVPERALIPVDRELSPVLAAMVEPLACAQHALSRIASAARLGRMVVFGAGLLGVGLALMAVESGVDVQVVDPSPGRREQAGALGLDVASSAVEAGAESAVLATADVGALASAVRAVMKGGQVAVVGDLPELRLESSLAFGREISLIWSLGAVRRDFTAVLELLRGDLKVIEACAERIQPDDLSASAFQAVASGRSRRPVIEYSTGWPA